VAGDSDFADVARGILEYANRDLRHPDGGYFSAEDADSPPPDAPDRHAEGAFYVWSAEEIDRVLGEDAPLFRMAYGVEPEGNVNPENDPHEEFADLNILFRTASEQELARYFSLEPGEVAHRLEHARNLLFECRAARPRPHRDEKILVAWNGLMISALARAAQVLGEAGYADDAGCAADFVWERLRDSEGHLVRSRATHRLLPRTTPFSSRDCSIFTRPRSILADFGRRWNCRKKWICFFRIQKGGTSDPAREMPWCRSGSGRITTERSLQRLLWPHGTCFVSAA
jgi:uncharacterized protein YyaL (SSP411 family)